MNPKKKAFLLPKAKYIQAKLIANATPSEVSFKATLTRLKIPFQFQKIIFTYDNFFIADFVVENAKGKKYLIELDGAVHFNSKAKKKDRSRSIKIRKSGYGVLRFKNSDVMNAEKVLKKLKRYEIL